MEKIQETQINIFTESTSINGDLVLNDMTRFSGKIKGSLFSKSIKVIISESALVEGDLYGENFIIDGCIKGNIKAKNLVEVSGTGRVIGNIEAPKIIVHFGAQLEGKCKMENLGDFATAPAEQLSPA